MFISILAVIALMRNFMDSGRKHRIKLRLEQKQSEACIMHINYLRHDLFRYKRPFESKASVCFTCLSIRTEKRNRSLFFFKSLNAVDFIGEMSERF